MLNQNTPKQNIQAISSAQASRRKMSKKIKILTSISIIIGLLLGYLVFAFVASRIIAESHCACDATCDGIFPFTTVEGICDDEDDVPNKQRVQPVDKPIIYLYPKENINVSVKLGKPELITTSYPSYIDGWEILAHPDGTLTDLNSGRELYSLYWEGGNGDFGMTSDGFVVRGADAAEFLVEKLAILGLNARESEEFIIYWLPKLQGNEYNYIRFASMEEINDYMPLNVEPHPDTMIRILMLYKPLDEAIDVNEQELAPTPNRDGFTLVEWGGSELE